MGEIVVIVPTYGRPVQLGQCLSALAAAGLVGNDVIVVDDASPDPEVAEAARARGVRVVCLATNGGPASARNAGVAACCEAEILFFVDSDVLVAPDVLSCLTSRFADPALAAVFGCYDSAPAATNVISRYVNLRHREIHRQSAGPAETFWAGCGAVRREAFEAVGGFDPASRWHFIEDVEFGRRLDRAGYAIRLDPALQGKHLKRWDLVGAARTDILFRARPWVGLMLEDSRPMRGLNADRGGRLSMLAVAAMIPCLLAALWWSPALLGILLLMAAIPLLNWNLFGSFVRLGGIGFASLCIPLHAFHLGCVGLGLAIGLVQHAVRRYTPAKLSD